MPIAASGAGTNFVSFGVAQIRAMVPATSASVITSVMPDIQTWPPAPSLTLNCSSCARKMTMASPLTKPSITGCGTIRMNLPKRKMPAVTCSMPISTTVANRYSTPCSATSDTITTAKAPVAPEIMPGRPPKTAVISPTINAA